MLAESWVHRTLEAVPIDMVYAPPLLAAEVYNVRNTHWVSRLMLVSPTRTFLCLMFDPPCNWPYIFGANHGWAVSSVQVRDSPPPPPLRALRAHLVTKGRLLAIHRVAPKAPENFVPFAGDPRECRVEVGLRRFLTQSISANPHGAPGPLTRDQHRIGQDGALYKCRLLPT